MTSYQIICGDTDLKKSVLFTLLSDSTSIDYLFVVSSLDV